MIIIKGEKATVIVIGDLLSEVDAGLRNYITYVGNSSEKIKEMTSVAEAMMKAAIRKRKKEEEKKGFWARFGRAFNAAFGKMQEKYQDNRISHDSEYTASRIKVSSILQELVLSILYF